MCVGCAPGYLVYCGSDNKQSKGDDSKQPTYSALLKAGLSPETQWSFLKLGLPGGLMMAADSSSFDVTTAMAGSLGVRPCHAG